jgi:hypothetical protein
MPHTKGWGGGKFSKGSDGGVPEIVLRAMRENGDLGEDGSSNFLGDPPPDPRFLASLGALSWVELDHCCVVDFVWWLNRSEGPGGGSSNFLADPPPDPRFLASLGAQLWVELRHYCVVDLFGG